MGRSYADRAKFEVRFMKICRQSLVCCGNKLQMCMICWVSSLADYNVRNVC